MHIAAIPGEDDAAHAVTGLRIAADKPMRIAIGPRTTIRRDRCTLGIIDARVMFQP